MAVVWAKRWCRQRLSHAGFACAAAAALAASACGNGAHQNAALANRLPLAKHPVALNAPGAQVRILSPHSGAIVPSAFTVQLAVNHFKLVGPGAGRAPHQGFGYVQFVLDNGRYDQPPFSGPNGRAALRLGVNGYYSPAYRPTIAYHHIPAGSHTLIVRLANQNDLATGVTSAVHFTVR
jgi:hypothetical protein